MTHRLVTLLCFSLQSGDVTERAAFREAAHSILLARNGKMVNGVDGDIDIFLFDSPTEAVLGATEVMHAITSEKQTEIRILVHTIELDVDSSVLQGSAVHVVREMLERTPWGDLCVSEASYLSMQRSEVGNRVEETYWQLKTGNRKVVMYRIKARGPNAEASVTRASEELAALRRALKPAPYDRRVLSMLVDYFITVVILLGLLSTKTLPLFWTMVTSRYVVEFENFDYDHAILDSFWQASNGLALEVGSMSTLTSSLTVKRGYYDAYLVYSNGSPHLEDKPFDLKIGALTTQVRLTNDIRPKGARPFLRTLVASNILLDGLVPLALTQGHFIPRYPVLDYFLLVPAGVQYKDRDGRTPGLTTRFEDILRLLYIWDADYRNFTLFNVFVVPPGLWLFQALCLSITTWTPGYLLFRLRVVTLRGEKPGPWRAIKRCVAQFISVFCLGFGWIWPLISHDERTWSDMFSETKVVMLD